MRSLEHVRYSHRLKSSASIEYVLNKIISNYFSENIQVLKLVVRLSTDLRLHTLSYNNLNID